MFNIKREREREREREKERFYKHIHKRLVIPSRSARQIACFI